MFKRSRYFITFVLAIILAMGVMYVPLPFYITKPGLAEDLKPYVQVEGGYKEAGDLMLVTVSMSRASIAKYMIAKFNKYHEIYQEEDILRQGETDKQFQFRQLHLMDESQEAAIYNAYQRANKFIQFQNEGVLVLAVSEDMPAYKKLQLGDQLLAVDQKPLNTAEEFIAYMNTKKTGDRVDIDYVRENVKQDISLQVKPINGYPDRVGIGVQIVTDKKLEVKPKVTIDAHRIGGPSAGLMFTLEIYNQLTKEDITKGYKIAGTGTINTEGDIGPIGGISQKIVAANNVGADIFFAPNEKGAVNSNYNEAIKTGKDIKTNMQIVPVDTLDDALRYLETLTERKGEM